MCSGLKQAEGIVAGAAVKNRLVRHYLCTSLLFILFAPKEHFVLCLVLED